MSDYEHLYDAAMQYPAWSLARFRIVRAATSHAYYQQRWHATDGDEREGIEREGRRVEAWCAAIADAVREGGPVPAWGDVAAEVVDVDREYELKGE